MKILIVVAHPDDEILGVGGTIAKHIAMGDTVKICVVTSAHYPEWSKSYISKAKLLQRKVDGILGTGRINLGFPTAKLNLLSSSEFNRAITKMINTEAPDVVYTHNPSDLHKDHQLIYEAVAVGVRPPKKILLLCFETLSETEWGSKQFQPNHYVDVNDFMEIKIKAFNAYTIENKKYPHPRSADGIINLAKRRGNEVCMEYAEAFHIVRCYG